MLDLAGEEGRRVDLVDIGFSLSLASGRDVAVDYLGLRQPLRHLRRGERAGLAGLRGEVDLRVSRG